MFMHARPCPAFLTPLPRCVCASSPHTKHTFKLVAVADEENYHRKRHARGRDRYNRSLTRRPLEVATVTRVGEGWTGSVI